MNRDWDELLAFALAVAVVWCAFLAGYCSSAELSPSTCAVMTVVDGRVVGGGSGVLVDSAGGVGYVLTCYHVTQDGKNGEILVNFPSDPKFVYKASILVEREQSDLALMTITAPAASIKKRAIAWEPTVKGQKVWQSGFGHPGVGSREAGGKIQAFGIGWIECLPLARSGDSGGPVVNSEGYVVGIISAVDARVPANAHKKRITYVPAMADNLWLKEYLPEKSK